MSMNSFLNSDAYTHSRTNETGSHSTRTIFPEGPLSLPFNVEDVPCLEQVMFQYSHFIGVSVVLQRELVRESKVTLCAK